MCCCSGWRPRWDLVAVILLGALLRLYRLNGSSIWYDEGATFYVAGFVKAPLRLFDSTWCTEPPLLPVLTWIWFGALEWITGVDQGSAASDFVARLLPWTLSVVCLPMTYLVSKEISRRTEVGLIATFLVAISPFQVYYAQELRPYPSHVLLALCALWCMLRALERNRSIYWIGLTFCLTASMYNHFFSAWVVVAFNVAYILTLRSHWRKLPRWTISQLGVVVFSYPAIRQGLAINEIANQTTTNWYPPLTYWTGLITFKNFFAGYSSCVPAYHGLFVLAGILAIMGCYYLRKNANSLLILLSLSLVPMIANLVVWQTRSFSYYEHRLFIFSAVTTSILIATALASIPFRWGRIGLLGAITVLTVPCLGDLYEHHLHPSSSHRLGVRYRVDNRSVAQHIKSNWESGDVVMHFSHVTLLSGKYYYLPQAEHYTVGFTNADREGLVSSFPARTLWERIGAMPERIDTIVPRAKRIWFVVSWWEPFEVPSTANLYVGWLDHHAKRVERESYFGVTLYLYDVESTRGAPLKVAQVGDYPDFNEPAYEVRGVWNVADTTQRENAGFPEVQPKSTFAVSTSLSEAATKGSTIPLQITMNKGSVRPLTCDVYASTETVEPLAFTRESPDSDAWYPVVYTDPQQVDDLDRNAMVVKLDHESTGGARIFADVKLPPGEYALVARMWCEISSRNGSRATLRFGWHDSHADAIGREIGEITPWRNQGAGRWQWFDIGRVVSSGQGVLTVEGQNRDNLPLAYADMGRVAFVRTLHASDPLNYGPIASFSVDPNDLKGSAAFDYRL
ncbi:MAG: glycosyltransferase family 39 protein, partial [Candidatus Hydrogenedentes bacterium]|nr:glycosyltransferase family 39 protein [Candidatus Hydrogenedentota bacterium]